MEEIFLDKNENLYGPAPKCLEVLRSIGSAELSMYSRDYIRGVKSSLTERLAQDLGIPEKQILLSDGSEDMLKQAVHCYIRRGEKILCPAESWWYYQAVASEVGGVTVKYHLKETKDRFYYDIDELISLYKQESPRAILIGSPNNPTGNSIDDIELQKLIEGCPESIIMLDEAYWGFADEAVEHITKYFQSYHNILVIRSFSKYYALAGARIAYAIAGKGITQLANYASHYLGYNRLSEALALAALDSTDYYERITSKLKQDRKKFYDFFDRFPGFQCYRSDANFVLVRVPQGFIESMQKALQDCGIIIKFFSEVECNNSIRITIGTQHQNDKLLNIIQSVLTSI